MKNRNFAPLLTEDRFDWLPPHRNGDKRC